MPTSHALRFAPVETGFSGATWRRAWKAMVVIGRTWSTRRTLLEMTARELSDIGVSRATAMTEARRMPWETKPLPQWTTDAGR